MGLTPKPAKPSPSRRDALFPPRFQQELILFTSGTDFANSLTTSPTPSLGIRSPALTHLTRPRTGQEQPRARPRSGAPGVAAPSPLHPIHLVQVLGLSAQLVVVIVRVQLRPDVVPKFVVQVGVHAGGREEGR